MNKKLLPIVIAAGMLVLGGCNGGLGYDDLDSLSISNKTEMQAEWYVGGSERTLEFSYEPEINLTTELNNEHLVISSSDSTIAAVAGKVVMPIAAGTATISVTYHEHLWDSVDVTISSQPTNKDKFGISHEGTLEDPLTNEDAVIVGEWAKLSANPDTTTEKFYISGTVSSFYHAPGSRDDGLVSWFLTPAVEGGASFEIYKCAKENGDSLTYDDIWKDGTAVAYGAITFYNDQNETPSATFVSCTGNKPVEQQTINATVTEALAVGAALNDGDSTYNLYAVTGYLVQNTGANYWMADSASETDTAKMIEIYNYTDTAGVMLKGAQITATMSLKNYHGTIENSGTPSIVLISAGTSWTEDEPQTDYVETLITSIQADTNYKFGLDHQNLATPDIYYATGALDGYYAATTNAPQDGADFMLVAVTGGYSVKVTLADDSVLYMNLVVSGDHTNIKFEAAASTVWTIDTTNNTIVTEVTGHTTATKDGTFFIGTSSSKTYTTLSCTLIDYVSTNYVARFYSVTEAVA